jgi:hypothetical protein
MSEFANTLADRFRKFHDLRDGVPLSIKLRSANGCFDCHGCNPALWAELDRIFQATGDGEIEVLRHETGPEWIVYATAALIFLDSVAKLVTTVLNARREGQAKGDKVRCDVELIVRGLDKDRGIVEEKVLRISSDDSADKDVIKTALSGAIRKMLTPSKTAKSKVAQAKKTLKPSPKAKRRPK